MEKYYEALDVLYQWAKIGMEEYATSSKVIDEYKGTLEKLIKEKEREQIK